MIVLAHLLVYYGSIPGNSFTGNVTGNLTGDVTGDVTGDLTGNASTATTAGTVTTASQLILLLLEH